METEGFGCWVEWQTLYVSDIGFEISSGWRNVGAWLWVLVAVAKSLLIDVDLEDSLDETDVFVVGDTATIVNFCTKELNDLVWDLGVLV